MTGPRVAVHLSPHPDDEVLGCGATLVALRAAGWRVVNVACGLGRGPDRDRRRAELEEAAAVLGLELVVADPPVAIGAGDDLDRAVQGASALLVEVAARLGAELVVSPHPGDGHHGHRIVGEAVRRSLDDLAARQWWAWSFWRDLETPNLYVPYGSRRLGELVAALRCHRGELERTDYEDALRCRARLNAVLGSERVFGFGGRPPSAEPYADLLTVAVRGAHGWHPAPARLADPGEPMP